MPLASSGAADYCQTYILQRRKFFSKDLNNLFEQCPQSFFEYILFVLQIAEELSHAFFSLECFLFYISTELLRQYISFKRRPPWWKGLLDQFSAHQSLSG